MKSKIHFHEFALLMALLMSIVSFSIDAVLPALGEIRKVFILQNENSYYRWTGFCGEFRSR